MLTLNPGAACDVCAEEYGPHCVPHSIPCGHVLCAKCCNTIVEKTPSRLSPVCPFCREQFTSDTVRLIRIDFTASRWNTPRFRGATLEAHDMGADLFIKKDERFPFVEPGFTRTRAEARRLEDKVAKVAAKKCSVEEVTTLHKELQEWLVSEDDQTSSLSLSAALLHAILMNHFAHAEASKQAKTVHANMKEKLDDMEMANEKLEAELRRQRAQFAIMSQECQSLRAEVHRIRGTPASRSSGVVSPTHESRRQSVSSLPSPSPVSPTPPPVYSPMAHSPLSRFNSVHTRSASVYSGSRSYTPSIRSQTPASPSPSRPPVPPKPRTLSNPSPPKMERSSSDEKEKEKVHQRWIPTTDRDMHAQLRGKPGRFGYPMPTSSRTSTPGIPPRYTTPMNSP